MSRTEHEIIGGYILGCVSCVGLNQEIAGIKDDIVLRLKEPTTIPIEAESICPDLFVKRSYREIYDLPVYLGRRKMRLGELFTIDGEKSDFISIENDVRNVKKIGSKMTSGKIVVHGDVGRHVGASMSGGEIIIRGNAADKAGINMQGGLLWIKGNTGHQTGSALPGENRGVNHGVIIVEGNAGLELGTCMRRGIIAVLGNVGDFAGARMIAGSILVFGHLAKRAGAGMKRGSIISFGSSEPLLPTYRYEAIVQPVFIGILLKYLKELGMLFESDIAERSYERYSGDINALGKGEIFIHVKS